MDKALKGLLAKSIQAYGKRLAVAETDEQVLSVKRYLETAIRGIKVCVQAEPCKTCGEVPNECTCPVNLAEVVD